MGAKMSDNLGCLIHHHVACYCSCRGSARCCGCQQDKPKANVPNYYMHCLVCGADLSSEVDRVGEFDQEKFPRGEPLSQMQYASSSKVKEKSYGTKKSSKEDKTDFAYKSSSGDSSSGAAY